MSCKHKTRSLPQRRLRVFSCLAPRVLRSHCHLIQRRGNRAGQAWESAFYAGECRQQAVVVQFAMVAGNLDEGGEGGTDDGFPFALEQ